MVDRRVVVNPRQARELLTAVTYVGQQRRGPLARGQRLMALYACLYFAALRPAEAVGLRIQDCYLPQTGWGRLTLEKSRPEVNRRWTDTGLGSRRARAQAPRRRPKPAQYLSRPSSSPSSAPTHRTFGIAPGRPDLQQRTRPPRGLHGHQRRLGRGPDPSPDPWPGRLVLAARPYDLRHAAVSLRLNAGVPPPR